MHGQDLVQGLVQIQRPGFDAGPRPRCFFRESVEFVSKWVHTVRYGLISKRDGASWPAKRFPGCPQPPMQPRPPMPPTSDAAPNLELSPQPPMQRFTHTACMHIQKTFETFMNCSSVQGSDFVSQHQPNVTSSPSVRCQFYTK